MLPTAPTSRDLGRTLRVFLDPDAAGDEAGWRRACVDRVVDLFRADHAYIQIASAPALFVGTGIDDATYQALEREYAETSARALRYRDPEMERLHRLGRRPDGHVFTRNSVSEAMGVRVEDTRIYREVCVPAGMVDFVGISAPTGMGEAMLWISRHRDARPFGEDAVSGLEILLPAFEAALVALRRAREIWPTEDDLRARFDLTPREAEVTLLLARGASEKRVARALGISPHTARHHTEKVFVKLGVRGRGRVAPVVLGAD